MNKALKITLGILFGILLVALFGVVTQYLWNWLMPKIFGLPTLTLLETFGLLLLSKILFGFGGKCGGHSQHKWQWKQRMFSKFENMSPEDRERFKARMKEKWCRWEEKPASENTNTSNG
jgi:hypothetical protein